MFTGVNLDNVILNNNLIYIKGPWCRRADHFSPDIEFRGMAGTDELVFFGHPWNCAAKVRAGARQGQETAIRKSGQVEFAPHECGHCAGQETIHRSGNDYGITVCCAYPLFTGLEKGKHDSDQFSQGYYAQQNPNLGQ